MTRGRGRLGGRQRNIAASSCSCYDLAISAGEYAIGALRGISDLDPVLFACDWPFAPDAAVAADVAGFDGLMLTARERVGIDHDNAQRLFPALAAAMPPG